jgi:transcription initiation factor TFIIE subunit beta
VLSDHLDLSSVLAFLLSRVSVGEESNNNVIMASKVSALEKLKADRSYLEELKRKSEKERKRRQSSSQKHKEEQKLKRQREQQELKDEQQRREERQRRLAKVSVDVSVSLKKVVDHLVEVKQLLPLDQVFKQLGCKGSKLKLLELLKKSTYVEVRDEVKPVLVKFKSKYDINNKEELLDYMFKQWKQPLGNDAPLGLLVDDVADSYFDCDKDVESLVSEGQFYQVLNPKTQQKFLFFPDRTTQVKPLTPALAGLWNDQKINEPGHTLDDLLKESGIAPATRCSKWSKLGRSNKIDKKKKQKQKREYQPRNVTNAHMPELFKAKQPNTFN